MILYVELFPVEWGDWTSEIQDYRSFWTMARYNTAVSNNEAYQVVRTNWAREMPDSKMVREGKYPGIYLGGPAVDYVALARSQGVEGERVAMVKELEPALRRGLDRVTALNR